MCKRAAFTLAEVLITLGIIGVVAAMTIPTLVANYKEKQTVTSLKKYYSTLANAFKMAETENGSIANLLTEDRVANAEAIFNRIKPYLKISKECGFETGCFSSGYLKLLDGRNYSNYDNTTSEYRFILSDGAAVMIWAPDSVTVDRSHIYGNIKIDINGFNGEYTFGKDVFLFYITNKGIIPMGMQDFSDDETFENYCNRNSTAWGNGMSCAAWVIYNENMDYLHCDDLSWDGKHSCDD